MRIRIAHIFILLGAILLSNGHLHAEKLGFVENKGQWKEEVLFRAELNGAYAFIERSGFTMLMLESEFSTKLHDWWQNPSTVQSANAHALKIQFIGASSSSTSLAKDDLGLTKNYYLGNDESKWASNVRSYERIYLTDIYDGIDLRYGSSTSNMKYDFIVAPGANPDQISFAIKGAEKISLIDGKLVAHTSVGDFQELAPFTYQVNESGQIEKIPSLFILDGNTVRYDFPEGYDTGRELIIDPELTFSSFVGSTSSNFGFTASYDAEGNLYAGAIVYGAYYPTTVGAYQFNFANGTIDCGISKFSSDGTDLLYSTYLGGSGNEAPHSIIVNENNELYVYGTTSSSNFPVSDDAFQSDFMGGILQNGNGFQYGDGCDIFVSKLNADGSDLLGSTFVGGSGTDGLGTNSSFDFNYGDRNRGEIVVDDAGNAYVASITQSTDFPIVNGYASSILPQFSGVVFKLSPNLDQMIWSTYSGGSNEEAAFSLQLADDNSVYFTGGTRSTDLPTSSNAYQSSKAGDIDGYIGHISADGTSLLSCTYNGTAQFDQNYFVQLDPSGDVYVVGQTLGDYPISGNVYSNPSSGQYIQKFSPDLSTSIWSTTIGTGGGIDISPSAFLVSTCSQIYISGWGGSLNNPGGGTDGLPITEDAFQSSTDDADFYLMLLDENASDLMYASYFGGNLSSEHVDGGTSRFDKNGTVYQAVCAGCGGNDDFPSQPGVWSQINPSSNCNLGVFKFELSSVSAEASIDFEADVMCTGTTFNLTNLSVGANSFEWDLGDGTTSNETELTHHYEEPGDYVISLYAEDTEGCLTPDVATLEITVEALPTVDITTEPQVICPGETLQLDAEGADSWQWLPADLFTNPEAPITVFTGDETTEVMLVGSNICGNDTAYFDVVVGNLDVGISEDQELCPGESVQLNASGGETYEWNPSSGLNDASLPNPTASPETSMAYSVLITTVDGCEVSLDVELDLLNPAPELESNQDTYVSCNGAAVNVIVSGGENYIWQPTNGLSAANLSNIWASPAQSTVYTVSSTNECGTDVIEIEVLANELDVHIQTDSVVCYNNPFYLSATGGETYIWQPADLVLDRTSSTTRAIIEGRSVISVTGFDSFGCSSKTSVVVDIFPREIVRAGNDRIINFGEEIMLESFSAYPIVWEDSPHLSCLNCNYPYANPPETTTFYASIETPYGCNEIDSVEVSVRGNIYVPNAFTPDGDGLNDFFKANGVDITSFKMQIFNRWGERVFVSEDIDKGWNGACPGNDEAYYCPPDVYQYRIVAQERYGDVFELTGTVTLIR